MKNIVYLSQSADGLCTLDCNGNLSMYADKFNEDLSLINIQKNIIFCYLGFGAAFAVNSKGELLISSMDNIYNLPPILMACGRDEKCLPILCLDIYGKLHMVGTNKDKYPIPPELRGNLFD